MPTARRCRATRPTPTIRSCRRLTRSFAWPSASTASSATRPIRSTASCSVSRPTVRTETVTTYRCWQDLPYREIWVVDTEFYPGTGTRNGGKHGDPITPYSLVAYEMRSRRIVRLQQHEWDRHHHTG